MAQEPSGAVPMKSRTPCSRKAQVGGSQNSSPPSSTAASWEHSVPRRPAGVGVGMGVR